MWSGTVLDSTGCCNLDDTHEGGLTPPRSMTKVPPTELAQALLSQDSSLALPLNLETPVMTPNGVNCFMHDSSTVLVTTQ